MIKLAKEYDDKATAKEQYQRMVKLSKLEFMITEEIANIKI